MMFNSFHVPWVFLKFLIQHQESDYSDDEEMARKISKIARRLGHDDVKVKVTSRSRVDKLSFPFRKQ